MIGLYFFFKIFPIQSLAQLNVLQDTANKAHVVHSWDVVCPSLAHRREAPRCNEVQRRDDRRVN